MSEKVAPPNKKKRQQPNKKWIERDVMQIIDYLQEEADFEAPTAQFFYKKFLEKSKLDVSWDLVRWKVRHLKSQFKKANDWLASTGEGVLGNHDDGGTIETKMLKICPYYNRLKEIFGTRASAGIEPIVLTTDTFSRASSSTQLSAFIPPSPSDETTFELDVILQDTPSIAPVPEASPTAVASNGQTPRASRMAHQKSAIGQLASIQKEKIALEKEKLKFQQQSSDKEKEIEERKLIIEEKKFELELRKHESEAKMRQEEINLKRLELEMKERLAKYEIDKKYK